MKTFSTAQAATITGIKYRTVDYWARAGILKPSISEAHGCGSERKYSQADVLALAALAAVPTDNAVTRKAIAGKVRDEYDNESITINISPVVQIIVHVGRLRRSTFPES